MNETEKDSLNKNSESEKASQENERTMEIVDIDPSNLIEIESQREDLIDYEVYRLKPCKIESVEVVRVFSQFAKSDDKKQHKLKITGEVVEVVEREGKNTIEIRPTELIGMIEDEDGKLLGLPESEDSKYAQLKKAIGGEIKTTKDLIGKELPMRIKEGKNNSKFLGFFY